MDEPKRLSLKQASRILGIGESAVRARFKAGTLHGERDNQGKIWVYVEPSMQVELRPTVQPSKQVQNEGEADAVWRELVDTLKVQVATLTAKGDAAREEAAAGRDALREKAEESAVRGAKVESLEAQLRREQETVEDLRARLDRAEERAAEPRGFWARLPFRRREG